MRCASRVVTPCLPLVLVGCDLLGIGGSTTVSGRVLKDGVPVSGVHVDLNASHELGWYDPWPSAPWAGNILTVTTDSTGAFWMRVSDDDCPFYVTLDASDRQQRRLTDPSGLALREVTGCGKDNPVLFDFRTVWYEGVEIEVSGQSGDTVTVDLGDYPTLRATFGVRLTPSATSVHQDSVGPWLWMGDVAWVYPYRWYGTDDGVLCVGCEAGDWYGDPPVQLLRPGTAQIIAFVGDTAFADTVTVIVRDTITP